MSGLIGAAVAVGAGAYVIDRTRRIKKEKRGSKKCRKKKQ